MKKGRAFVLSFLLFSCLTLLLLVASLSAQEPIPSAPAGENNSLNVEQLGQIGGERATAVAVQGTLAFVGFGSRLVVFDISNPNQPISVGQSEPFATGDINNLTLVNNFIYVTADTRLWIFSVADPTQPKLLSWYETPGEAYRVAVANNHAYLGSGIYWSNGQYLGGGMSVLDVSNPFWPVLVGFYGTPYSVFDVAVVDNYAYLAQGNCFEPFCSQPGDLRVIDISDPTHPAEVTIYNTNSSAVTRVVVDNQRAFVIDEFIDCPKFCEFNTTLRVVDISNPNNVSELGDLSIAAKFWELQVVGNDLYLSLGIDIYKLDVTNPANIVELDHYPSPNTINDFVVAGETAVVANGSAGLRLLDASNPDGMTELGFYDTPTEPYLIEVVNDYAYIGAGDGLHIMDVSEPGQPRELGSVTFCLDFCTGAPITIGGNYAYWAGRSLAVVDISDPTTPTKVGTYTHPTTGGYSDIELAEEYAYLIYRTDWPTETTWLQVMDISTPMTPSLLSEYQLSVYSAGKIALSGNYAYISSSDGLLIIDISDPADPVQVGIYDTGESLTRIVIADHYLYGVRALPEIGAQLWVLDISEPTSPIEIGYHPLAVPYPTIPIVVGHHVYIGDAYVLRVIDFSEKSAPRQVGYYGNVDASYFEDLAVAGNTIYADGLTIFRFTADSRTFRPDSGGTLVYNDEQGMTTTTNVRPATFAVTTTLVYGQLPFGLTQSGLALVGHGFDLTAYQNGSEQPELAFLQPITLTVHYSDANLGGITDEAELSLQWQQEGGWQAATTSCAAPVVPFHDPILNVIRVPVCRPGRFGLFGPTNQIFLPFVP